VGFAPPIKFLQFLGTLGADTSGLVVDAWCGANACINAFTILYPYSDFRGANVGTGDADNASPAGGGADFRFTRNRGFGVPARFTVEVYRQTFTDGPLTATDTVGSGQLTMGSTDLVSTAIAVPADTETFGPPHVLKKYNVRLTKAEVPWILA